MSLSNNIINNDAALSVIKPKHGGNMRTLNLIIMYSTFKYSEPEEFYIINYIKNFWAVGIINFQGILIKAKARLKMLFNGRKTPKD